MEGTRLLFAGKARECTTCSSGVQFSIGDDILTEI
jgi:hypothetical protein